MIVRDLNLGDIPALREIARHSFSELWGPEEFRTLLVHTHGKCIGAWGETGLMGYFLGLQVVDELDVVSVAVAPGYRQQGVGRKLLDLALQGAKVATLEVAEGNAAAIRLYERAGFKPTGRRRRYYRGVEDAIMMTWNASVATQKR